MRAADGMFVRHEAPLTNDIGEWNPAWGARPEIQRLPSPRGTHPRYHLNHIVCPNRCNEAVETRGPDGEVYDCAVCGAPMTVTRIRPVPRPRPTSVNAGERYGRLTVLSLDRSSGRALKAVVRCDCGVIKSVWAKSLRSGHTRSCGCLARDLNEAQEHPWRHSYKGQEGDASP